MKQPLFDASIALKVETAVCEIFNCSPGEISGFPDSTAKKVVVFILSRLYGFDVRKIGSVYQMTYLYVPTVVDKIELQMLRNEVFREKIINVSKMIDYEFSEMDSFRRKVA